jgi:hypothetical protein
VVITGSIRIWAGFSDIKLRAFDIRADKVLTNYSARIQPDDSALAKIAGDRIKPIHITEKALAHFNRGEDMVLISEYDGAIRELD